MTFDTLSETETRFREVAGFYACLNAAPFEALSLLLENPATQRRIEGGRYQPSPTVTHDLAVFKVPKTRLLNPASAPPSNVSNAYPDWWTLRRYEPRGEPPNPNAGHGYKIGSNDVGQWLYFARLVPLRDELPEQLRRELSHVVSDAEERSRAVRLADFARLLDKVSGHVEAFGAKTLAEFQAEVGADGQENWGSIFQTAKSFVPDVRGAVKVFRAVVGEYVPSAGKIEPVKSQTQQRIPAPEYANFADLFINKNDLEKCVDALRKVRPPVVNDAGVCIGTTVRAKIIAWLDVLEQRNKIQIPADKRQLSKLVNDFFPGLKMNTKDSSIYGKSSHVREKYHADFLSLIK